GCSYHPLPEGILQQSSGRTSPREFVSGTTVGRLALVATRLTSAAPEKASVSCTYPVSSVFSSSLNLNLMRLAAAWTERFTSRRKGAPLCWRGIRTRVTPSSKRVTGRSLSCLCNIEQTAQTADRYIMGSLLSGETCVRLT